ncbi:hypothetical protein JHK86_006756 [Glycine max]|nr:hypothetical protein JHK86_006756 [Glycine max]
MRLTIVMFAIWDCRNKCRFQSQRPNLDKVFSDHSASWGFLSWRHVPLHTQQEICLFPTDFSHRKISIRIFQKNDGSYRRSIISSESSHF